MGTSQLARSPGIGCRVRAEVLLVKAQVGLCGGTVRNSASRFVCESLRSTGSALESRNKGDTS
jgi:hypothetical protein